MYDNVAFPLREHTDLSESMVRDIVLMKLEAVGLRGARRVGGPRWLRYRAHTPFAGGSATARADSGA